MIYRTNRIWTTILLSILAFWYLGQAPIEPSTANAEHQPTCTTTNEILLVECATATDMPTPTNNPTDHSNQFLIGLEANMSDDALKALLDEHGLVLKKRWTFFDGALVELDESSRRQFKAAGTSAMEQARITLESETEIRYVTYNEQLTVQRTPTVVENVHPNLENALNPVNDFTPNDPEFPNQWALNTMRAVEGWGITQGDPDVVVAVINSGYDLDHPELGPSHLWVNEAESAGESGVDDDNNGYVDDIHGWNFANGNNDMSDETGLGTSISGAIAAITNNEIGISGIGRNIKVMPLKILEPEGAFISDLVDALEYTRNIEKVHTIDLGLFLQYDAPSVADAVASISETKLLVSYAGNVEPVVNWPAAYPETIAVVKTNQDDNVEANSNGPEMSLGAPGVGIWTLSLDGGVEEGTAEFSATAYVSALAALIASIRPDFSPQQIRTTMEESAVDINAGEHPGFDNFVGHGRIDIYQALFDASAGLQMHPIPYPEDTLASVNNMIELGIRVQTPITNVFPVENAVVQYELVREDETETTPSISGHVLTNANGRATITLTDITEPESYVLRTQVGQASAEFSIAEFSFQVKQKTWMPIVEINR